MNKITIIGHVGGDPVLRYTPNGDGVCNFSIASNRNWRDRTTGEQQQETTWFNVSAWGNLGEICDRYLGKGQQVYVEGRVRGRTYTDRNGQTQCSLEVTLSQMQMLGNSGARAGSAASQNQEEEGEAEQYDTGDAYGVAGDEEIEDAPF